MHEGSAMPSAEFSITSLDPSLLRRLLGVTPTPTTARQIHNAGVVMYRGSSETGMAGRQRHGFVLEFGTENAAGIVANWMWSALHGHVSSLEIGGEEVPMQNAAIKRAILTHAMD
jgi:hypothetical protein